jgi:hypothetical protein
MRLVRVLLASALLLAAGAAGAQERLPRFADYPSPKLYTGKVKRPVLTPRLDPDTRMRLRDLIGASDKANFAGHYHVAIWGCGSACVTGSIVDARTGVVTDVPFTISGWREVHDAFEGITFRPDSRLIVFSGERNEKGDMGQHFYVMEKGRLTFLKTVPSDGNFMTPVE